MLAALILVLLILWLLGYLRLGFLPDMPLFIINGQPITLWNLITFIIIVWAIGIIPSPIREIAAILLILWILSLIGILAIGETTLANYFILAIIIGLIISLVSTFSQTTHP